jgi:lipopolysaccharide export LptBFGC system permease protein LptF
MRLYRGCIFSFFGLLIALFSFLLSRTYGLVGLVLPSLVFGFTYLWVDSFLAELIRWDEDRNRG